MSSLSAGSPSGGGAGTPSPTPQPPSTEAVRTKDEKQKEDIPVGDLAVGYNEMNDPELGFAVEIASEALKQLYKGDVSHFKDVAAQIKHEFDRAKGGAWHVIVGKSFGSFVTHETKTLTYFHLGPVAFMIFKHG